MRLRFVRLRDRGSRSGLALSCALGCVLCVCVLCVCVLAFACWLRLRFVRFAFRLRPRFACVLRRGCVCNCVLALWRGSWRLRRAFRVLCVLGLAFWRFTECVFGAWSRFFGALSACVSAFCDCVLAFWHFGVSHFDGWGSCVLTFWRFGRLRSQCVLCVGVLGSYSCLRFESVRLRVE